MIKVIRANVFIVKFVRIFEFLVNIIIYLYYKFRYLNYSKDLRFLGENVFFGRNVSIYKPNNIFLGDNVYIGDDVVIHAYDDVLIGNDCSIAAGVKIISGNHRFSTKTVPIRVQGHTNKPITIEEDCWLGFNVTVLAGSKIGRGSIIGANVVVSGGIEPFSIIKTAQPSKSRRFDDK